MKNYDSLAAKKEHFNPGTWKVINTAQELDDVISEFTSLKRSNQHALFRGICESKYKLYTSLQRECFAKNIDFNKTPIRSIILKLIENGRDNPKSHNILPEYFAKLGIPLNDWMLLAILQHYGAPSPLLDFTKDYMPALYFMCLGMKHFYSVNEVDQYASIVYFKAVDACAHVIENLTKTGLNIYKNENISFKTYKDRDKFVLENLSFEKIMGDRDIELIPSYKGVTKILHGNYKFIANIPISNMNMASQEGEFICSTADSVPIEDLMVNGNIRYLHCINIHKSLYNYIIERYLMGSLEEVRKKLFPTEYQAAQDIYSRTMSSIFKSDEPI